MKKVHVSHSVLSLRAVTHNTCSSWVRLIFSWCYKWKRLLLIEFNHKVTSLLWVWRTRLQVTQNLLIALSNLQYMECKYGGLHCTHSAPGTSYMKAWLVSLWRFVLTMLPQKTLASLKICSVCCACKLLCFWMGREGIEIFHHSPWRERSNCRTPVTWSCTS